MSTGFSGLPINLHKKVEKTGRLYYIQTTMKAVKDLMIYFNHISLIKRGLK